MAGQFLNTKTNKRLRVPPYQALAPFYDHVMQHVDYDGWVNHVIRLAELHGLSGRRVIDLSCGTGVICQKMSERNFLVFGCDASKMMLKEAVKKAQKSPFQAHFVCGDMRNIPLRDSADLVISLYDSMNYLLTLKDWVKSLQEIYSLLKCKGLFIFDVSTVINSEQAFKNYHHGESTIIGDYHRRSVYHAGKQIQYNYFNIVFKAKPDLVFYEQHRQKIYYIREVKKMIEASPFKIVGCYSGYSLHPANENAERVHFVLQK